MEIIVGRKRRRRAGCIAIRKHGTAVPVSLALLAADRFRVELGSSFPLSDAAAAHDAIEAGVDGKITLIP